MPYPKDHAARTRERILASAYALFISRGYEATSIDQVMQHCGLTRGAFYAHFDSKSALYRQAILHAAGHSGLAGEKPPQQSEKQWIATLLDAYLDRDTAARNDWPCPLAFFATDVARREPGVRAAYTQAFASMSAHIHQYARCFGPCSPATATAMTAMLIGAVAVARTLDRDDLRDDLLAACRAMAVEQLALE